MISRRFPVQIPDPFQIRSVCGDDLFESCCLLRDLAGEGRVIVELDVIEAEVGVGIEGVPIRG